VSNLSEAVSLVLPLFKGHREPEPLRYVHNVSLKADATVEQIEKLCKEALQYNKDQT